MTQRHVTDRSGRPRKKKRRKPGPKPAKTPREPLRVARWALIDLRCKRGMTQADLGRLVGVTRTIIGQLERGTRELVPPMDTDVARWLAMPDDMTTEALYAVSERDPVPHYIRNTGATRTVRAMGAGGETTSVAVSPECRANVGPVCNSAEVREITPT